jgi:RNA polymerase sigma-70 factor (ECF subfamily)
MAICNISGIGAHATLLPRMATESTPSAAARALDDLSLVRRIAQQDAAALGELYDRYAPLLLGVTRRILAAPEEAEEALQEAFLDAWSHAAIFDPARSSVATWLALLARSHALGRLRSRRASGQAVEVSPAETRPGLALPAGAARDGETSRLRRVREAIAALPEEQQRVIDLVFWEALSPSEIAMRTATPLAAVKSRAMLGMRTLRQTLRDEIRSLM